MRHFLAFLGLFLTTVAYGQHVAKPDPLSPADEQKTFKVPEGFEVQLVAAEPDIQKPIQIAFDAKGRLWVTTSYGYPFAAEKGKGKDKLFVLSDFGPDGKAKKVETFSDTLNIPIGVLPLPDCKSCLVSECGRILKLTDTDNDGKADKVEELFTGFGYVDTHGMTNSFLLMPDGWVYATHGFKNTSKVKAKDGSEVTMNSGNTYRFKPDGSRIEIYTRGQVNPFGLTCDPWLNLYSADCHSKPITQLIRGAHYDSFGKPHDGLGYAPHVTQHDHGSTGLCGLAWYDADHFPAEYKGHMFLGNVVTNRINHDKIIWKGSTPVAEKQPDLLVSTDPWFRPTDIKLGLDGALYFADFYNRIIGHYEVDLKHPQRDKDRGRVWRIVWKGKDGKGEAPKAPHADLTTAKLEDLVADLASSNITVRLTAYHELVRRLITKPDLELPGSGIKINELTPAKLTVFFGMMAFLSERIDNKELRLGGYDILLEKGAKSKPEDQKQFSGIVMRALGSRMKWEDADRKIAIGTLDKFAESVWMRRAIVDGMTAHPHADFIAPLLKLLPTIDKDDNHLRHATRIALRNAIETDEKMKLTTAALTADEKLLPIIIEMMLAIPDEATAKFLIANIGNNAFPTNLRTVATEHIGRRTLVPEWLPVVDSVRSRDPEGALLEKLLLFQSLLRGAQVGGHPFPAETQPPIEALLLQGVSSQHKGVKGETAKTFRQWYGLAKPQTLAKAEAFTTAFREAATANMAPSETRIEAAECFSLLDSALAKPILRGILAEVGLTTPNRDRVVAALLSKANDADFATIRAAFKTAPYASAVSIGNGLAGDRKGAEVLLEAIQKGEAPTRLLQEKLILERLRATKPADFETRLAALTKGLPTADARLANLIRDRAGKYPQSKADAILGKAVFTKHCAACHQIGGQGAKIGPQLDGIGIRGLDRVLEDTLDPNRNVDAAFRATTITTLDGRTIIGLVLREEGEVTVMADPTGKEVRIAKNDVDKRSTSLASAMPANLDTTIPEADYYHLMSYLLDQKPKDK